MKNGKRGLPAAFLTVAAACLASTVFTSYAFAQCAECALYPDRDPWTQGLVTTPAPKPRGAVSPHNPYNAHAEMRGHHGRYVGNLDHRHR